MPLSIVVAIDFGTTRSAWAYKVKGEANDKIMVRVPDTARDSGSSTVKTETAVLMEDGGKGDLIKYGVAAHAEFLELQANCSDRNEAFFRWFKLALCGKKRFTSIFEPKVKSSGGHEVPLLNVMKAALKYFKEDALDFLSKTSGTQILASNIKWVLTVPAIYDQYAKSFMRYAAHEAGIIDSVHSKKLRLCLEPEAACLSGASEDGDHPLTVESVGKQIMILDCGGGTIDITMHDVIHVNPLKLAEAAAPKGRAWGSTYVDKEFESWLEQFLGNTFAQIQGTATFLSIMAIWERKKAEFQGPESGYVRLNFSNLAQDDVRPRDIEELRCIYNSQRSSSDHVGGKKYNIVLPATLVNSFFTPTIDKITDYLVRDVKQECKLDKLHRVFLVGGFSHCPMLQKATRGVFQNNGCSVVTAHEADILIVKGAVAFFNSSSVFVSRKARFTYGINTNFRYDATDPEHRRRHEANGTYQDSNGLTFIENCFNRHVTIGQDIPLDGTSPKQYYWPHKEAQKSMTFSIYASKKKDPCFIDEDGCFKIGEGTVNVDMSVPRDERGAFVQFTYGGTELLVDFFHKKTGEQLEGGLSLVPRSPGFKFSGDTDMHPADQTPGADPFHRRSFR